MRQIGNEMHETCDLKLESDEKKVLDLCMAPGGYTASVLVHSPHANVSAITLPEAQGGKKIMVRHDHVKVLEADITMFATEFGFSDIPADHTEASKFIHERPWRIPDDKAFNLIFCDGHISRTQDVPSYRQPTEQSRLTNSQLILAMQRISRGGTLVMRLHGADVLRNVKLLNLFNNIAKIKLFKPLRIHAKKTSFYLIAKDVKPDSLNNIHALKEWKQEWKNATFPALADDGISTHDDAKDAAERSEEASKLMETFGERLVELGEPIWEIQKKALKGLMERIERQPEETGTSQEGANATPAALDGSIRDANASSQLDVSVANTSEEGTSVGAGAVGGQEQSGMNENAGLEDIHAAVDLMGLDQASTDSAKSASAQIPGETAISYREIGPAGGLELDNPIDSLHAYAIEAFGVLKALIFGAGIMGMPV